MSETIGLVAEIQHYCIQDGPGIRTTVFLKGCPLKCKWCHNPEMISTQREVWYNERICTGCGLCIEACPAGAISGFYEERRLDTDLCRVAAGCTDCVKVCPPHAMSSVGRELPLEAVVDEVLRDKAFYRRSGGGACISGGEPLLQAAFTTEFLKKSQASFVNTSLETCGYGKWETLAEVAQYVDYFLIDLKHMDSTQHQEGTGVPNELILENVTKLAEMGKKIRIRLPIIPDYNDDEVNLKATAEFMVNNNIKYIDLLAYHTIGEGKYEKLGKVYTIAGTRTPSPEEMDAHRALFDSFGLLGTIGGTDIEPF